MIRLVLIIFGTPIVLLIVAGWLLMRSAPRDMWNARRLHGRCAVPGCGRPAGHWKAAAQ